MIWASAFFFLTLGIGPTASDAPAREPQFAVSGSTVALTFGAGHALYFSRSTDSGKTFSQPVKVAEGDILPLTRHRGPRIALMGSAVIITAVTGKTASEGPHSHGLPSDGNLIAWRSSDGGKTWSQGRQVNDVPGAATEGLHALTGDGKNRLFAAWLDKRDEGTKLYGSRSDDGGLTWSKNFLIYASPEGTICQCCHPSVAISGDGSLYVMWRNWLNGSRDLYLTRSSDGAHFSQPQKLGEGTWKLNACPMDGGSLVTDKTGVVTAWRREHSVFIDRPGQPEREIGQGTDVAIASGADGIYAIWVTPEAVLALKPGDAKPRSLGGKGAFPAIAALPNGGALAAWESDGKIAIQQVE